ncbi:MAG TPA: alpha-2-macroglobulin family protein, partial [Archangium sp.]|uniref:alpha-2-macroglobulin family protein n=1 Tax=Archangium sp. TaxID=1872627 RepID=UPI002EDA4632
MKRYIVVGGLCVVAGFTLSTCLGNNLRRLTGASADALAGSAEPPLMRKNLRNFGANEEGMAFSEAPAAPRPQKRREIQSIGGGSAGPRGGVMAEAAVMDGMSPSAPPGEAPATPGRAWFPETFLFEPLVVTDASGLASVPVKVPDRLTQWRVLALAHSRSGAQAGAVARFAGTL